MVTTQLAQLISTFVFASKEVVPYVLSVKNNVFAYNAKTGAVTAQLLSTTKPIRTFKPSSVPVHTGLSPNWAETPKTCFLASGLNNDLFCAYMRKRSHRSAAR